MKGLAQGYKPWVPNPGWASALPARENAEHCVSLKARGSFFIKKGWTIITYLWGLLWSINNICTLLSQSKPWQGWQGSLCNASCVKHQLLWAGMLPAQQGFCLQKHVILEEYFKERKVQLILQNCFIFPNFTQMQKCADIFSKSAFSWMPFHLTHQLLANAVRLHILGHLMPFAAFCLLF